MGSSVSTNTATAMASVTNDINNSTTVSNSNFNEQKEFVTANHCEIDVTNDIDIIQSATVMAQNKQIAQGMSNTDLKNDIQQKMMQEAMSSVGSFGVGYTDASNSASMFASSTSAVTNEVKTQAQNISDTSTNVNCNDSVIRAKNISIQQGLSNDYTSNQVAKSNDVTKIANSISQTAQQKATAKVAGLAGFLIALAILIIAMGWSFSEVAESVPGVRAIVMVIVLLVVTAIIIVLYVYKCPPLFNDPTQCSPNFSYGSGKDDCTSTCINPTYQTITLDHTPMKYLFSIVESPPSSSGLSGSLLQMIVSSLSSEDDIKNNQGYTASNADKINTDFKNWYKNLPQNVLGSINTIPDILKPAFSTEDNLKYLKIPVEFMADSKDGASCTPQAIQLSASAKDTYNSNISEKGDCIFTGSTVYKVSTDPTSDPNQGGAALNSDEWRKFSTQHPGFARFILLRYMEISSDKLKFDLSIYEDDEDPVVYKNAQGEDTVALAKDVKDKVSKYFNQKLPEPTTSVKSGAGTLSGPFGVCANQSYKAQIFVRKVFWTALPTILMIFFAYEIFRYRNNDLLKPLSIVITLWIVSVLILWLVWKPWGRFKN